MKGKILLVDDNIDMLLIGQRIFSRAGYDFISARNGQEGLEKARLEKPDIIVLDYMLPDINGSQFIKTIGQDKAYDEIKETPIVILTARSEFIQDIKDCFALGLRAFLNKPFGHRELVNVIENIIHLSRYQKTAP
ncbi:response regulator, partial [candidate division KSB1 bacterium]|nr:response regulator [candidate division KSB1 bacterium]